MDTYKLVANVGIGQPTNGELIFNIHFISIAGVEWTASYSYGQLCQIDNFINFYCSKIKHVAFPVSSKQMIEKLRSMLEIWVSVVLMRLHSMPLSIQDQVEKFFALPNGPNILDADTASSSSGAKKPSIFSFLRFRSEEKVETYEKVCKTETDIESSKPPLIKLNVVRGPEGPHGKQEYQISIIHNTENSEPVYIIYRRFSEFAVLYNNLLQSEPPDLLFTSFPIPPSKCKLGMALDESELSIRTRQLDAWLRDVVYHYRLMSSTGKACVRNFLNMVAASRDDYVPERDGGGGLDTRSQADGSSASPREYMLASLQNRLADGLYEAPRAENYDHVMKGAQKNRILLQSQPLSTRRVAKADDDDEVRSEDSRFDEDALNQAQIKSVKPFSFRSIFSKNSSKHVQVNSPNISAETGGQQLQPEERKVNKYIVPEACVSGDNPFVVPFVAAKRQVLDNNERGIMGMLETPYFDGSSKINFRIRHQDFDPNLFIFGEDSSEPAPISSSASVSGRVKSPSVYSRSSPHR